MDVDVVVVTYRSADHLGRCLEALPPVASVTVVDNASGDGSAAIAREHGARVLENAVNRGFAAAANQGAATGSAGYILFLNPDAAPKPGCVEALAAALDGDAALGLVGPVLEYPDGQPQRSAWPFPTAGTSWREAVGRRAGSPDFVVGACLLVRRTLFDSLGGFDESFWLYGEEADLARRAATAGWTSRVVEGARCEHVGGASGGGSDRSFEEFQRGTERFILKHDGRAALLGHRLGLLAGSLARIGVLAAAGRRGTPTLETRTRIARRLLHTLWTTPLSVPASPTASSDRPIVLLSLEAWDEVWRRNQFLVRELLAADDRRSIVFVEPPHDPLHALVTGRRRRRPEPVERGPIDRLTIVRPTKLLPRAVGPAADWLLRRSLLGLLAVAAPGDRVFWVNDPAWASLSALGDPLLYDVTDDWTKADRPQRVTGRLQRWDEHLTRTADVVVVCSPALRESHKAAADLRLIPNGVDVEHFRRPRSRPEDLPTGTTVVYVGTLHEDRLDVPLVARLATACPEVNVVLVGPVALSQANIEELQSANVHLLGPRPYSDIPAYLQAADALIVPHVVSEFTDSLDPIKAYECAAVGRPTVATPVAGFREHPDVFTISAPEEFMDAVAGALRNERPGGAVHPDLASWAVRASEFARALGAAQQRTAALATSRQGPR